MDNDDQNPFSDGPGTMTGRLVTDILAYQDFARLQARVALLAGLLARLVLSTTPGRVLALAAAAWAGWWLSQCAIGIGVHDLWFLAWPAAVLLVLLVLVTVGGAYRNPQGAALRRGWRISRVLWSDPHYFVLLRRLVPLLGILLPCALPLSVLDRPGAYSRAELAKLSRHHGAAAADYRARLRVLEAREPAARERAERIRLTLERTRGAEEAALWAREEARERAVRLADLRDRGRGRSEALATLRRQGEVRRGDR